MVKQRFEIACSTTQALVRSLEPGDLINGSYRVRGRIATGGMGDLFEVVHRGLDRVCVLKVLRECHMARPDFAERLRQEARLVSRVGSPAAPAVYDAGALDDGRPYFVMEKLEGCDLKTEIRRLGMLAVPTAVSLVRDLLRALEHVHACGVVHRDIKLANVWLSIDGSLKILDFGIALRECATLRLTGQGVALGTPRSMAPEQHAALTADARADVYAAGLVLFELLTGTGPFDRVTRTLDGFANAHRQELPPSPALLASQFIPPAIARVVLRALEKSPAARYQSARAMADALDETALDTFGPLQSEEPTDVDPWAQCVGW